ncbi:hypothetical protein BKA61DRAFT_685946 [Leptodontidium sp. MPI-SDFR-AT-0119]|nr:hypothetical protein BKA61DRAFT_685946 [Leptodontidium sp. MPI-SDFR-AT-0119]
MFSSPEEAYSSVAGEEPYNDKSEDSSSLLPPTSCSRCSNSRPSRRIWILTGLNAAMLLASLSLFGSWWYQTCWVRNSAYKHVSSHSPIFDRLDLDPSLTKINGTFPPPRQRPNPTADKVWDEILIDRFIPISRAEIVKMGKNPDTAVKLLDSDWGLGGDAYAAGLDVFHQLHCVDFLRRTAYGTYYNETSPLQAGGKLHMAEVHVNHCVDLVGKVPFAGFFYPRQCANFQNVWDWRMENTLDSHMFKEVFSSGVKPEGIQQASNLFALDH